jgi:hypothetical protein
MPMVPTLCARRKCERWAFTRTQEPPRQPKRLPPLLRKEGSFAFSRDDVEKKFLNLPIEIL